MAFFVVIIWFNGPILSGYEIVGGPFDVAFSICEEMLSGIYIFLQGAKYFYSFDTLSDK